jgi:predicted esterase
MSTTRPISRFIRNRSLVAGLLVILCPQLPGAADTVTADGIYERKVLVPGSDAKEITFFVKLPSGVRSGADIKGVFSFCTWESDSKTIRDKMADKLTDDVTARVGNFPALANGMAVVSWTTFTSSKSFDKTRNFDEMTRREAAQMDREFDKIARTWRKGIESLIKDYQLPANGWFLHGISRGGQWAHRLALREADLFGAVHIHINSSYDQPTPEGAKILWLVSTGELEAGYPAAKRFYAAARKLNYPMIFYAEPKLGHDDSTKTRSLGNAFFSYALARRQGKPEAGNAERFVGDYLSHEFVPVARAAQIPSATQVFLPSQKLAEIWGIAAE